MTVVDAAATIVAPGVKAVAKTVGAVVTQLYLMTTIRILSNTIGLRFEIRKTCRISTLTTPLLPLPAQNVTLIQTKA